MVPGEQKPNSWRVLWGVSMRVMPTGWCRKTDSRMYRRERKVCGFHRTFKIW